MSTAARLAEIDRRYAWHHRHRRETRAPLTITTLRTAELERIFRHRFGGRFPANNIGIAALVVMAEHHIQRNRHEIVVDWIRSRAPWADKTYAEGIAREAAKRTSRQTAGALGWRIKLTTEERRQLRIKTIRAMGQTDETMAEDRRERDKERKTSERRAMGCKTREQYEAESLSQTRPWERFGISRRTWERRGKPMPDLPSIEAKSDASPSTIKIEKIFTADGPASPAQEVPPSAAARLRSQHATRCRWPEENPSIEGRLSQEDDSIIRPEAA